MEAIVEQLRRAVEDVTAGQVGENGSLNRSRVLDVSGIVQAEQEKKQQMKEEAIARRLKKELQECTFKPALSQKSMDMLAQSKKERPALHERGERKSGAGLVGAVASSPAIDERSRKLAARSQRSGPVFTRLMEAGEETKRKHESSKQDKERLETESFTGKPQLNKKSEAMARKKNGDTTCAVSRLTETDIERRRENLKRIEMQHEAKVRESTETKTFINATSRRLASRLEAEGRTSKDRLYNRLSYSGSDSRLSGRYGDVDPAGRPRPTTAPASGRRGSGVARSSGEWPRDGSIAEDSEWLEERGTGSMGELEQMQADCRRLVAEKEAALRRAQEEAAEAIMRARQEEGRGKQLEEVIKGLRAENEGLRKEVDAGKALRAQLERRDKAMEEMRAKHSREVDEIMSKSSQYTQFADILSGQIIQMNAALKSKVEEFNRKEALANASQQAATDPEANDGG